MVCQGLARQIFQEFSGDLWRWRASSMMASMRILVAPQEFKGSLSAREAGVAIAAGLRCGLEYFGRKGGFSIQIFMWLPVTRYAQPMFSQVSSHFRATCLDYVVRLRNL